MWEPTEPDAETAAALAHGVDGDVVAGRVEWVEPGVVGVRCPSGLLRASVGGALLARVSEEPAAAPRPGDWGVVRRWPDRRLTLELVLPRRDPARGVVTPLRAARRRRRDTGEDGRP